MSASNFINVSSCFQTLDVSARLAVYGKDDVSPPGRLCLSVRSGCASLDIQMTPAECRDLVAALSAAAAEFDAPVPAPRFGALEAGQEVA